MTTDFDATFAALRALLTPYAPHLVVAADTNSGYYLNTAHLCKNKQPLFFGATTINKSYVSYHLMPIYVHPALLATESPALRKRRQGKSCYNFTRPEPELFAELARLTEAGFAHYRDSGMLNGKG